MINSFLFDIKLSLRNIIRQKRRSTFSVSAVIFGTMALILAGGFIEWIFVDFRETTIKSHLGHLQIVRPGYHQFGKANPYNFLLPNISTKLEMEDIDFNQIEVIAPRISFNGLISFKETTLSFVGEGVDPQEQIAFGNALQISSGLSLSIDKPSQIIVGEGLARNLGISVGDQVILLVTTSSGGINAIEVTVRGLFSTVTKSYDDSTLRMSIETLHQLLRTHGAHIWIIHLKDTSNTNKLLSQLQEKLPHDEFEVVPWYKLAEFYNKTVTLFTKQVNVIKIIIVMIILFSISNTMTMSVMERIGEIGTAMALGVKRINILRQFLFEGILIGFIGGLLGLMMGICLANIVSSIGIPMPPPPGMARGYTGEILVTWDMALEALMLAVSATLVASVYPSWKASRMQIVDTLRHNR